MRHRLLMCSAATLFATASAIVQIVPETDLTKPPAPQVRATEAPAYPDTPEGLKTLLGELFDAEKAGDARKSSELYAALAIPNHAQWFAETFGKAEGARLDTKYASSFEGLLRG